MKMLKQQGSTYMVEYVVGAAAILAATITAAGTFETALDANLDTALAAFTTELASLDGGDVTTTGEVDIDGS